MDGRTFTQIFLIFFVIATVSASPRCDGSNITLSSTESHKGSVSEECCKVEHEAQGLTVIHFPCDTGCCGEKEHHYCCPSSSQDHVPGAIVGSVCAALLLIGVVLVLVRKRRKSCCCDDIPHRNDHRKLIKEVYSAKTLEELFVPSQPLVSAPGTIIHPTTNISGPFYAMDAASYVMPDLNQSHLPPPPPLNPQPVNDEDDENEDNWETWDGFASAPNSVGVSALSGVQSSGRGRDNPHYEDNGEEGGADGEEAQPYYYEQYDKYSQPPPGYEEVMK